MIMYINQKLVQQDRFYVGQLDIYSDYQQSGSLAHSLRGVIPNFWPIRNTGSIRKYQFLSLYVHKIRHFHDNFPVNQQSICAFDSLLFFKNMSCNLQQLNQIELYLIMSQFEYIQMKFIYIKNKQEPEFHDSEI